MVEVVQEGEETKADDRNEKDQKRTLGPAPFPCLSEEGQKELE